MKISQTDVQTALLEDYAPETVVSGDKQIKAINDQGNYLFTQGSDDVLRLLKEDSSEETGWKQIDITKTGEQVSAFDVYQDPNTHEIILGYAARENNKTTIKFTDPIQLSSEDREPLLDPSKFTSVSSVIKGIGSELSIYFSSAANRRAKYN